MFIYIPMIIKYIYIYDNHKIDINCIFKQDESFCIHNRVYNLFESYKAKKSQRNK